MEFKNPWLQDPLRVRSTLEIPIKIRGEILRLEAKDGAVQTTASILINKFLHELAKLKLDTGDRYGYQSAVLNTRITICDNLGNCITEGVVTSGSTAVEPPARSKRSRATKAAR